MLLERDRPLLRRRRCKGFDWYENWLEKVLEKLNEGWMRPAKTQHQSAPDEGVIVELLS